MSPKPQASGVRELGRRWGITRQAALKVVARPGFPEPQELEMGRIWSDDDIATWEAAEHAAGRAIPGETGYGPARGTGGRPRRQPGPRAAQDDD